MKTSYFIIAFYFTLSTLNAQSADELNKQSKELIAKQDYKNALPILRKAAEQGSAEAQYNLGYFLSAGVGTNRNVVEGIKWYRLSSENGFNDGHYAMMMAYGNGEGVQQNSAVAFQYAIKCANNNDPTCIWNVVTCYATGMGVNKNEGLFKTWIFKLAKLENPENLAQSGYITSARLELAKYYLIGNHFPVDLYQSYLWYIIYNENKVDFSILKQDEVIKEIKELEKSLSSKQLETAKKDAENLIGRDLRNFDQLYKNTL
ncbi:tetratricopeptide repeat protein [Flavobacterium caeni]|uniref:Sel1 repeat-containing protein n=1 Tax=Flavobacterium caeni TaxID=490189 RepID=A0A1G5KHN8_9FLAO|nr:tetratricopeptide repeat protein [Flavobacterium caeni]SCY99751.1 Sel1 repeat-containing protein [Flavobacterium caeni]